MQMENAFYALTGAIAGCFVGLRTNCVIDRVFEHRAVLHKAMIAVRLMSERAFTTPKWLRPRRRDVDSTHNHFCRNCRIATRMAAVSMWPQG